MGRPPLRAQDFMANNPEHLELLRRMGVSLIHLKDGRVQLVQHATQVNSLASRREIKKTQLRAGIIEFHNSNILLSCFFGCCYTTRVGNDELTNDYSCNPDILQYCT